MCNHNKHFKDSNNTIRCSNCFTELQEKPKTYKFWALLFIIGIALTSYTNVPVLKYYKPLTLFEEKDVPLQQDSIVAFLTANGCILSNVAYKQILIESGGFKSKLTVENHNIVGIKHNRHGYSKKEVNNHAYYLSYRDCLLDYCRIQSFYLRNIDGKYALNKDYIKILKHE